MDLWRIYRHANPANLIFGAGSLKELRKVVIPGAKIMVVTDKGVVDAGIVAQVTDHLNATGSEHLVYDKVVPDAPVETIEEAATVYLDQRCEALLAVGGGSPIDAAKAVGVRVTHPGDLRDYGSGKPLEKNIPSFTAIPTTAGTGAEVTGSAVIADPERRVKMVIRGSQIIPQTAILDPLLLSDLPPRIAAETGADALSHALEGLVTRGAQPFSDALTLHAIRLIFQYLRPMVGDPSNLGAASNMLIASAMASMGWANAGLGLVHSLAHPLGAHHHVSHGRACGLYLPIVMEFNAIASAAEYRVAAEAMGQDVQGLRDHEAAEVAIMAVRELLEDVGVPRTYAELGIDFELREEMVNEVLSVPSRKANPRRSDRDQIISLFNAPRGDI
jgi:alcohol dehydrogenase class IV